MSPRRTAWKMTTALLALLAGCTFEDPNAPPPQDTCIDDNPGVPAAGLWTWVDGPPNCGTTNPARREGDDTMVFFTGAKWNLAAAMCRGKDLFLGATPVINANCAKNVPPVPGCIDLTIPPVRTPAEPTLKTLPKDSPPDAIGYCVINKGTASEIVAFNTCGLQTAGQPACEDTLTGQGDAKVTAEWFNCPGGALCAPVPDDVCLKDSGDGRAYAMYVDNPEITCPAASGRPETQDMIFYSLNVGFQTKSAICTAASAYDSQAGLVFGVGPAARIRADPNGGLPQDESAPQPTGAKGYCLINEGKPYAFVLFSMCDEGKAVSTTGADGSKMMVTPKECTNEAIAAGTPCMCRDVDVEADASCVRTPKQSCEKGASRVPKPRKGTWFSCPGSPFCK